MNFTVNKFFLIAIPIIFFLIYCSISLVNHYNFRTFGWDLGLFNNTLYDAAHLQRDVPTLLWPEKVMLNISDHFSFVTYLVTPFYYLFGNCTLLLFQLVMIILGGLGIYKLILELANSNLTALFAMTFFYLQWGIYSALSFDFHENVIAAMIIPWFIYFLFKKNKLGIYLTFILVLISKENMALWMSFICIGLIFISELTKDQKKLLGILGTIALVYFILAIKVIIPSLGNEYRHFTFNALGNNFGEVVKNILLRPQMAFELFFESPKEDLTFRYIKSELHFVVLLSGGIALLLRPQFLIMLIPIYAQKLFNNDPVKWGVHAHYSIEFAPILTIAFFYFIIKSEFGYKNIIYSSALLLIIVINITLLDHNRSVWFKPDRSRFYSSEHWHRNFNVDAVHQELKKIPKNARVSAQSPILPHIANRDFIYHYPYVGDAEYLALLPFEENAYPKNNKEELIEEAKKLVDSGEWTEVSTVKELILLKRVN